MGSRTNSIAALYCVLATLVPLASAQYGASYSLGSRDDSVSLNLPSLAAGGSYDYTQTASFKKSSRILIVHAVLGTLAWAFFAPLGAIFLRLDLPGVNLLRIHMIAQIFVYAMMFATTGLGIWMTIWVSKYGSVWMDSHIIVGLIVFSISSIQPWLGWCHHIVFKRRLIKYKKGIATRTPGRTVVARFHIWIGRTLILLGVVNGGLGLRLAARTPHQTLSITRKAEIAYGVLAGLMFLVFVAVSVLFEYRRAARIKSRDIRQEKPAQSGIQSQQANRRGTPSYSSEGSPPADDEHSGFGR